MDDLLDMVAADESPANISDKIKEILFTKASERIEDSRPVVSSIMFGLEDEESEEE